MDSPTPPAGPAANDDGEHPYRDPNHALNGPEYLSGRTCVERGCGRPAGTFWSPFWCQPCNATRMDRIGAFIEFEAARYSGNPE